MVAFVSLEEQKEYSRIQHDALDVSITTMIEAKSAAVSNYLKEQSAYEPEDLPPLEGLLQVRPEVRLAVLVEVDEMLNFKRSGSSNQPATTNYLSDAALRLLYPLRDPELK